MRQLVIILMFVGIAGISYSQLTGSVSSTINTLCQGTDCNYEGPSILINELLITPATAVDGSISGVVSGSVGRGEWIELYNPDLCNPVDISCYFLGNSTNEGGGGYLIPQGTIIPPAGFCVLRGENSHLSVDPTRLVQNGGNVVEIIAPYNVEGEGICSGGDRLWFPNTGGWFAFYDANGVPQDAVGWGMNNPITGTVVPDASGFPCVPTRSECNISVSSLASFDQIPSAKKKIFSLPFMSLGPEVNKTFRRIPDGGAWVTSPDQGDPTIGNCNAACAQPSTSSCAGTATVNVSGGSGTYSYQWNDSESQTSQTAVGLCAGTYQVVVTDGNGATVTFTVTIEDLVLEPTIVSHINPACQNNNGQVVVGSGNVGQTPYTFSVNNGASQGNGTFTSLYSGAYDFAVQDVNGCVGQISFTLSDEGGVSIDNIVTINPSCPTSSDGGATVTASGGQPPYTYGWMDNVGNPIQGAPTTATITGLPAGVFSVSVTDANGCSSVEIFTLTAGEILPPNFDFHDYCEGHSNGPTNIATPGGTYSFAPESMDGATIHSSTGIISNGVGGTTYSVMYTTPGGCSTSTTSVVVFESPTMDLSADITEGEPPLSVEFTNASTGATSYIWDFADGSLGNSMDAVVSHTFEGAGVFEVTLIGLNAIGCESSTSIVITTAYPGVNYEFPNVMTPNGDGVNDFFMFVYQQNVAELNIIILNRWGNVVFESDDVNFNWNGKVNNSGTQCTDGTYFYKAEITSLAGEKRVEHGFLELFND